ncbi:hypothetical protein [Pseudomonas guariconensis]|uniref:hypothetical protein n=1 Tax=Pseudomonas guariconensis TaxID=1288410 RepID=UPI0018A8FAE7|nr:hypothetical protein [Pseudomonas guariconensis]MBF8740010.1 hypothetical protein [Pseudomonas guariconensis]MBF8749281.1 hypothetical protein [Pseudomonas guariconensis]
MSGATTATYVAAAAVAASTVYSAYSSVQQGKQAQLNADAQSEQTQLDADNSLSAAKVQAERIRKMARAQSSEARASLAGSGVMVDEGTALDINKQIISDAEEDAVLTIFNGENQRKRGYVDAHNMRLTGAQGRTAANMQATSSVLAGAANIASGWKSTKKPGLNMQGQADALNTNPAWVRNS